MDSFLEKLTRKEALEKELYGHARSVFLKYCEDILGLPKNKGFSRWARVVEWGIETGNISFVGSDENYLEIPLDFFVDYDLAVKNELEKRDRELKNRYAAEQEEERLRAERQIETEKKLLKELKKKYES